MTIGWAVVSNVNEGSRPRSNPDVTAYLSTVEESDRRRCDRFALMKWVRLDSSSHERP